jgi:hypothetical protein
MNSHGMFIQHGPAILAGSFKLIVLQAISTPATSRRF